MHVFTVNKAARVCFRGASLSGDKRPIRETFWLSPGAAEVLIVLKQRWPELLPR